MSEITRVVYDGREFVEPTSNNTPPPAGPAPTPAVQIKAEPGVLRTHIAADGSTVESHTGPVRMNSNELFSREGATGILATAVNSFGRPVSGHELTPKSIVTIPNGNGGTMTLPLSAAEHAHFVTRSPDGSYRETTESERAQGTTQEDTASEREAFASPTDEAALTSFATTVPTNFQHSLVAAVISGQEISRTLLEDAAASVGKTPEAFRADVQAVFGAFQSQAVEAIKSLGLADSDLPDFAQWAQTNHRDELADATRQQVYARSTKGFKELANKYLRATPPTEDVLRKNGYKLGKAGDGKTTTVFINGTEMNLATAAKQGLI